ncbi:hypothetical protein CVT26_007342 [Gymnopilus dilepis]|uniref:BTB domain-containing protein n=1 Tax=Gymnopilus dilepis TaxID=231916 RepID=A0A409VP97_9AGAR|nr:hypothetical protein CVT26_007342 [Gymnopilus dilepis]
MLRTIPAPAPFDHPAADVILRSSDKEPMDFRFFKMLLTLSSPFFSDIFTLPQPNIPLLYPSERLGLDGEKISLVQMAEDKETLQLLLGLCTPISVHESPRFSSLQEISKVAEAALKFEMDGVLKYLRGEIISLRFIEAQPLRVFAIAYRYGWDEEARKAARYTLRHSIDTPFFPELEFISGATLHKLRDYHRMCGEVASSRALLQPALAEPDDQWTWITCKRCPQAWNPDRRPSGSIYDFIATVTGLDTVDTAKLTDTRKWWVDWVRDVAKELRTRPWGETAKKWDLLSKAVTSAASCPACSKRAREDLEAFSLMLSVAIEKDISSVELDLSFDDWSQSSPAT